MTNTQNESNILEGTIAFWVQPGKVNFSDNKISPICNLNPENGSIFIVKDNDNKIKMFHVYMGKGRTDVEYDISSLDQKQKHMFAFTWSVPAKEINIYIDGKLVAKSTINY